MPVVQAASVQPHRACRDEHLFIHAIAVLAHPLGALALTLLHPLGHRLRPFGGALRSLHRAFALVLGAFALVLGALAIAVGAVAIVVGAICPRRRHRRRSACARACA